MSVFDAQSIHTCYIVSQIKIIMLSIIQKLLVSDVTLDIDTLVCVGMRLSRMSMIQTLIPTNSHQSHLSSNVTVSSVILSFSHCDS